MYKDFYNEKLLPFVNKVRMACNVGEIPLVFDNSLTYYEQIAAFSAKLNDVISTVNVQSLTLCEFMQQLTEAFKELSDDFAEQWQEISGEYTDLSETVGEHGTDITNLDLRVTALENAPGVDGVGKTIETGTEYTQGGQTYTAGNGAEIFNEYTGATANGAAGNYSHAEGHNCKALADYSHAEGYSTVVTGSSGHAEGAGCLASGLHAHAEGFYSQATGGNSHAQGNTTTASGAASTAIGTGTTAADDNMLAMGAYNNSTTGFALVIGNGTASDAKSDLFKIGTDGTFTFGANTAFDPQADHNKIAAAGSFVPVTLTPTITPGSNFTISSSSLIQCGKVVYFSVNMIISQMIYVGPANPLFTLSDFPKPAQDVIFSVTAQQSGNNSMYTIMAANTTTWAAKFYANDDLNTGNHLWIYGSYITSD